MSVASLVPESNIPIPDPSLLTTVALQREIASLRELLEAQVSGHAVVDRLVREILETRLGAMDKATELLSENSKALPTFVTKTADDKAAVLRELLDQKTTALSVGISALRELMEQKIVSLAEMHAEKFNSVQTQFRERDVRTEQSS